MIYFKKVTRKINKYIENKNARTYKKSEARSQKLEANVLKTSLQMLEATNKNLFTKHLNKLLANKKIKN